MTTRHVTALPMRKPRTKKDIVAFLENHFRYYTAGSWNRSRTYAVNIKIHRLNLTPQERSACYDLMTCENAYCESGFNDELEDFDVSHDYQWQTATNGRSGGYAILLQGGIRNGKTFIKPLLGLDEDDRDFAAWDRYALQERFDIVWAFDTAVEYACRAFLDYAVRTQPVEETIMAPTKVTVARPRAINLAA